MNRIYAPRDASQYRYRNGYAQAPRHYQRGGYQGGATEPQVRRIKATLLGNALFAGQGDGDWERCWAQLEAHDTNQRTPGDGTPMARATASRWIDTLTAAGYQPVWAALDGGDSPRQAAPQPQAPRNDTPAEVGVYRQDGKLYVVREFTPQGEHRKVRYAREIVPLTDAQGDRLNQQGNRVRIEERKVPGMQYRLTKADALPMAEVTALSIQWESCLVCGRHLRVAESVERGIGPVCHARQAALLGS